MSASELVGESLIARFLFVFLLHLVNYIDGVNVSFANLKMGADPLGGV
jgi:hypothetical protein